MELLKSYRRLPIRIERDEEDIYIVNCAAWGFYTYGQTVKEGLGNFEEVVGMCVEVQRASICPC